MAEHIQERGQKNTQVQLQGRSYSRTEEPGLKKWSRKWPTEKYQRRAEEQRRKPEKKEKKNPSAPCDGSRCCPRNPGGPFRSRAITDVRVGDAETSHDDLVLRPDSWNITSLFFSSAVWKGERVRPKDILPLLGQDPSWSGSATVEHIEVTLLFICLFFF